MLIIVVLVVSVTFVGAGSRSASGAVAGLASAAAAVGGLVFAVGVGVLWLYDETGLDRDLLAFWRALAGVDPAYAFDCLTDASKTNVGYYLVEIVALVLAGLLFGIAIIGPPVGWLVCVVGGLIALAGRGLRTARVGLVIFGLGLLGIVGEGLMLRVVNIC